MWATGSVPSGGLVAGCSQPRGAILAAAEGTDERVVTTAVNAAGKSGGSCAIQPSPGAAVECGCVDVSRAGALNTRS